MLGVLANCIVKGLCQFYLGENGSFLSEVGAGRTFCVGRTFDSVVRFELCVRADESQKREKELVLQAISGFISHSAKRSKKE